MQHKSRKWECQTGHRGPNRTSGIATDFSASQLRFLNSHAVKWDILAANPIAAAEPPRVTRSEIEILKPDQIGELLDGLRGRPLYPVALIALSTGMRRGEIVALRWDDVDLDGGQIRVERSLEQTNSGISFKEPKTKAGRRSVSIPQSVVGELRDHWRNQQEQRLALGIGKSGPKEPVFIRPNGSLWPPDSMTTAWQKTIEALKLPKITLRALRHTHVSRLIAGGLDVVSVSRRIGHSNPTVTLTVYAHMFGDTGERAAAIVEKALGPRTE